MGFGFGTSCGCCGGDCDYPITCGTCMFPLADLTLSGTIAAQAVAAVGGSWAGTATMTYIGHREMRCSRSGGTDLVGTGHVWQSVCLDPSPSPPWFYPFIAWLICPDGGGEPELHVLVRNDIFPCVQIDMSADPYVFNNCTFYSSGAGLAQTSRTINSCCPVDINFAKAVSTGGATFDLDVTY